MLRYLFMKWLYYCDVHIFVVNQILVLFCVQVYWSTAVRYLVVGLLNYYYNSDYLCVIHVPL